MKRKVQVLFAVLIFSLSFVMVNTTIVQAEEGESQNQVSINTVIIEPTKPSIKSNNFDVINERQRLPKKLINDMQSLKEKRGFFIFNNEEYGLKDDGYLYVFISSGEKPTLGYSINVDSVTEEDGKTLIVVKETSPGENEVSAQMVSYPNVLIRIKNKNSKVIVKNLQDGMLGHMILGKSDIEVVTDVSIMPEKMQTKINELKTKNGFYLLSGSNYDINDDCVYILISKGFKEENYKSILVRTFNENDKVEIIVSEKNIAHLKNEKDPYNYVILKLKDSSKSVCIKEIREIKIDTVD